VSVGSGRLVYVLGVGGFSKEANSASKSLSGEAAFEGASSLCVVVGVSTTVDKADSSLVRVAVVEFDDHHQPMV
jgi:hypothetical protein